METVIIFRKDQADGKTERILKSLHITQQFSDRVFVIEEDTNTIDKIKGLPGVIIFNEITAALKNMLSHIEMLSLHAWKSQNRMQIKERIGDGLNWGDERFQAPR